MKNLFILTLVFCLLCSMTFALISEQQKDQQFAQELEAKSLHVELPWNEQEQKRDTPECAENCNGHGQCTESGCVCDAGYTGDDCSIFDLGVTAGVVYNGRVRSKAWDFYHIIVSSSGSNGLVWSVEQTSAGDVDLYIRRNGYPSRSIYDARDIGTDERFSLQLVETQEGVYYGGVYGYTTTSYSIQVSVTTSCANDCSGNGQCLPSGECNCNHGWTGDDCSLEIQTITTSQPVVGNVGSHQWRWYLLNVLSNDNDLIWSMSQSTAGDCDLYLKHGALPNFISYDYRDISVTADFEVVVPEPQLGRWFAGVFGFRSCSYTLQVDFVQECSNDCSGDSHGRCLNSNGVCICNPGYIGDWCQIKTTSVEYGETQTGIVQANFWNYYQFSTFTANNIEIFVEELGDFDREDCDLYVREGSKPTHFLFDYRDISVRSSFSLVIENPGSATWYIGMLGYSSCSYSLRIEETQECPNQCSNHGQCDNGRCICDEDFTGDDCSFMIMHINSDQLVTDSVPDNQWRYYALEVNPDAGFVDILLREVNSNGYLWLFVASGDYPTVRDYDYSDTETNTHLHQIDIDLTGETTHTTYFVGVFANPLTPEESSVDFQLVAWVPFQ
mmetsp:Transcript_21706/g.32212  ORF Transcript_21706/g.32212 Transcript_21706/m.32212 type:complete len:613 (+) Transcript_21706:2444-4282(+)